MGVYGLAKFHIKNDEVNTVGILTGHARRYLDDYTLKECSQLLSSLSRLGLVNRPLMLDVSTRVATNDDQVLSIDDQSLCNLMTSFARLGMKRSDVWTKLADQVETRLSKSAKEWSPTDMISTVLAYSISHPPSYHEGLFSCVSRAIRDHTLSMKDLSKYIRACSTVQYRDIETLSHCASCLRKDVDFPSNFPSQELLHIYTNLDKLGVDMKELNEELSARGVSVPKQKSPTWFPANFRQNRELRKRRYS
jgi:hypothetical protein